jgi:hypothetical protein
MKISTILDKIDDRQLFVPAFQREYVWKRDDAKALIDSLIKEYPTGTMLLWETASPPELKGSHKYDAKQGAVRILLDGQQRITTLYMLIRGNLPPYYSQSEIVNDTRGLYVNLDTLELAYYMKKRMESNPLWQNVTDIFQSKVSAFTLQAEHNKQGASFNIDELEKFNRNITAIKTINDREFPEQTIPIHANIREAIDIFYKVNSSGVALTEAELALAQISGFWPQARDLFKAKLSQMESEGFGFKLDFLIYVLLGCLHHMGSDMRKLHNEEDCERLKSVWKILDQKVLDYVVNIMRSQALVDHIDEIGSPYALVPIFVYCFDNFERHLTAIEIQKMVKWFYYSQIRTRYVSQLPQKLDQDLRLVKESNQPFDDLLQVISEERPLEIQPQEFAGRAIQHPLFSMVRWYLKSRNAVCLSTGMALRRNMGKKYQLELDHIFPFSKLKEAGYGKENRVKYSLAQELTNRALLTQEANRSKSAMDPEVYLSQVMSTFPSALELQCIPTDTSLWKIQNYEAFLEARRAMLATHLNKFLAGITVTGQGATPATIEDLISEGESDELEFKSTLRWDLREKVVNKKLEEVIVKTIAALANTQGGTLLIGVEDDGQICGLSHDYETLEEPDRDHFELHFRNVLGQQFGTGFTSQRVRTKFQEVGGQDIFQVDVTPAREPVIVQTKDKNGQPLEKFYVRNGNASHEIGMSEISAYMKERFQ